MSTYLHDIKLGTNSRRQGIQVNPRTGETRLVVGSLFHLGHADNPSDVILHDGREARAFHASLGQTTIQLGSDVDGIITLVNCTGKKTKELTGSLEHGHDLANSDELGLSPWELAESADQAFIRSLRTLLGEGRLEM